MGALLGVVAVVVARVRCRPGYCSAARCCSVRCFSYRRSFWIATVLWSAAGGAARRVLGRSPAARAVAPAVGVAISLLGSTHFQSARSPLLTRSFADPDELEANVEDRYRLDERANVLGASATSDHRPWHSGPLGGDGQGPSHRTRSRSPPIRALRRPVVLDEARHPRADRLRLTADRRGGARLAGVAPQQRTVAARLRARIAVRVRGAGGDRDTATFTAADPRFTVLLGAQIGLLALLTRRRATEESPEALLPAAGS